MILSIILYDIVIPCFGAFGQQGSHHYLRQLSFWIYVVYYYHFNFALFVSKYFGYIKQNISSDFFFKGVIKDLFVLNALGCVDTA